MKYPLGSLQEDRRILEFWARWWNRRCSAEVLDRIEDLLQVKSTLDASTTLPDDLRPYQMFMRELHSEKA